MALHSALGLLFLGGGRYTIDTSPAGVAALVVSLFPRYPRDTEDNRYHLQALRHMYVLAVQPRCLQARDVDTGKPCYVSRLSEFASCAPSQLLGRLSGRCLWT